MLLLSVCLFTCLFCSFVLFCLCLCFFFSLSVCLLVCWGGFVVVCIGCSCLHPHFFANRFATAASGAFSLFCKGGSGSVEGRKSSSSSCCCCCGGGQFFGFLNSGATCCSFQKAGFFKRVREGWWVVVILLLHLEWGEFLGSFPHMYHCCVILRALSGEVESQMLCYCL